MESPFLLIEETTITWQEAVNQGLTIKFPFLPRQERAFPLLSKRESAAYLLYRGWFKIEDICTILGKSKRCINYYISKGCDIYGQRIHY